MNDVGSLGTKFILPKFTDDNVCKIIKYEVSQVNTDPVTNPESNFVSNPTAFS